MKPEKLKKALEHLSKNDKTLSTIIKNNGICNLTSRKDFFNSLLEAIIGQQLSLKAAGCIIKRFYGQFGINPHPADILAAPDELLRSLGLSNAKVKYVKDLSDKVLKNTVKLDGIEKKNDEGIYKELVQVKGIGKWTIDMFLIFTLGRENILPTGDLGLKNAIVMNYKLRKFPEEKDVEKLSKKGGWAPYNSIASLYLWETLNKK